MTNADLLDDHSGARCQISGRDRFQIKVPNACLGRRAFSDPVESEGLRCGQIVIHPESW